MVYFPREVFCVIISFLKQGDPEVKNYVDTVVELKELCREHNLSVGGKKVDLIKRLYEKGLRPRREFWDTVEHARHWNIESKCPILKLTFYPYLYDKELLLNVWISWYYSDLPRGEAKAAMFIIERFINRYHRYHCRMDMVRSSLPPIERNKLKSTNWRKEYRIMRIHTWRTGACRLGYASLLLSNLGNSTPHKPEFISNLVEILNLLGEDHFIPPIQIYRTPKGINDFVSRIRGELSPFSDESNLSVGRQWREMDTTVDLYYNPDERFRWRNILLCA